MVALMLDKCADPNIVSRISCIYLRIIIHLSFVGVVEMWEDAGEEVVEDVDDDAMAAVMDDLDTTAAHIGIPSPHKAKR